jgi:hypothetical protein
VYLYKEEERGRRYSKKKEGKKEKKAKKRRDWILKLNESPPLRFHSPLPSNLYLGGYVTIQHPGPGSGRSDCDETSASA